MRDIGIETKQNCMSLSYVMDGSSGTDSKFNMDFQFGEKYK